MLHKRVTSENHSNSASKLGTKKLRYKPEGEMKTAIIYHYFEVNQTYKENFIFFLNTAIFNNAEYFIYISGNCSLKLPEHSNVKFFFIENKNNDFAAVVEFYKYAKSYVFDAYVFVNSSVRGPFLTTFNEKTWHQIFTSRLSADIALVGSSINLLPESSSDSKKFGERHKFHPPFIMVQTTAYALSSEGYKLLAKKGFFEQYSWLEKQEVVFDYEIQMSQIIMENGFSLSSLLPTLDQFNSDRKTIELPNTLRIGDPLFKSAFYGRSLSPLECIFIKTNRDMISERELCSYTFTELLANRNKNTLDDNGLELLKKMSARIVIEDKKSITHEKKIKKLFQSIIPSALFHMLRKAILKLRDFIRILKKKK